MTKILSVLLCMTSYMLHAGEMQPIPFSDQHALLEVPAAEHVTVTLPTTRENLERIFELHVVNLKTELATLNEHHPHAAQKRLLASQIKTINALPQIDLTSPIIAVAIGLTSLASTLNFPDIEENMEGKNYQKGFGAGILANLGIASLSATARWARKNYALRKIQKIQGQLTVPQNEESDYARIFAALQNVYPPEVVAYTDQVLTDASLKSILTVWPYYAVSALGCLGSLIGSAAVGGDFTTGYVIGAGSALASISMARGRSNSSDQKEKYIQRLFPAQQSPV